MKRFAILSMFSLALCVSVGCDGGGGSSSSLDNASDQEIADVRAAIEAEQAKMQAGFDSGNYDSSQPLPKE